MGIHRPSDGALIGRDFFEREPVVCARELVGAIVRWGRRGGMVVETEAYDVEGDEACHTFHRPMARAFVAGHRAGAAYIYLNYGMHWMLNVLVKGRRSGFVLIRAIEPLHGIPGMRRARGVEALTELCSGPGKLARALGVDGSHHGIDLCGPGCRGFHAGPPVRAVACGPRIGISRAKNLQWRFLLPGNPHVSRMGQKEKAGRTLEVRPA